MNFDKPQDSNNIAVEDFQDFVASRMNEPIKGLTALVANVSPANRQQSIVDINLNIQRKPTRKISKLAKQATIRNERRSRSKNSWQNSVD